MVEPVGPLGEAEEGNEMERSDAGKPEPSDLGTENSRNLAQPDLDPIEVSRAPEPGRRCAVCDVALGGEHLRSCKYTGIYSGAESWKIPSRIRRTISRLFHSSG